MPNRTNVCLSLYVPAAERREFRRLVAKANAVKEPGPTLSGSYIVRALLKAYREGLEVPGLPTIPSVGTDNAAGSE